MHAFKDSEGREWQVSITVSAVKRVREIVGFDLVAATEGQQLAELAQDPVRIVDVVYALCKPQADERGVKDEAFGEAMAGDAIDAAVEALLEELVNFSPSRRRPLLVKVLEKTSRLEAAALAKAAARLDDPELERRIERVVDAAFEKLDEIPGEPSTTSPGSAASTPGPTPSANSG